MGAVGALVMAAAKGRLSLDVIQQALASTTRLSSFVLFILIGARVFSLTFYGVNGHHLGRAPAGLAAGRRGRLPDRRQHPGLPARLLPRFLRARLHHRAAAGAGRRQARHRPDLVRRAARRQHADLLHAPAVRLRAVLPALGRRARALSRPHHRQADRAGHHRPDLLGRRAIRLHPGDHDRADDRLPANGDALQGHGRRSGRDRDQGAEAARSRDCRRRRCDSM